MTISFRKAKSEDIAEIITLCNECFEEETEISTAQKIFEETKNDPNQIYLIGILDGKIITHVKLTIVPTMYKDMNTYSIMNHFCVKKEYRRHHIATAFLKEIFRVSKEMNCSTVKLWSNNIRKPAHACYYKNGFVLEPAGFFTKVL